MATSSEDVLLMVPNVRYRKHEGVLYLMNERLALITEGRENVTVSHKYSDIKLQKISPEGKAKVQLQVVLHDNAASTFQFVNPEGQSSQIKDRDSVKDLLQQLLPKFKKTVNKDLEEKNKLLSENPQLLQLYVDLVISHIITADEFWNEHAAPFIKKQSEGNSSKQEIGVSPAFLADIQPQADGANGLRYNLTADMIQSIFKTYPSVKRKHLECVPAKMTETEFWSKFFHSHYFHRDRLNMDKKDPFADCAKMDEQVLRKELTESINDPLLDLNIMHDCNPTQHDQTVKIWCKVTFATADREGISIGFNQHSIMVLKAAEQQQGQASSENQPPVEAPPEEPKKAKRARIHEAVSYDDLEGPQTEDVAKINLTRIERYLNGPTAMNHNVPNGNGSSSAGDQHRVDEYSYKDFVKRWMEGTVPSAEILSSSTAVQVLGELSVGGSLMRGAQQTDTTHLSEEVQKELRNLYLSLSEILRHFWAAYPPTTPQLMEKANKMAETLQRFSQLKVSPFEQTLVRETSEAQQILKPLRQQIDAAFKKQAQWAERRIPARPP
nr:EOG090X04EN [Eulimnadia texana]